MRRRGIAALALLVAAGCELEEVSAPPSADVLVVEAVLRTGSAQQNFILHRSVEGRRVRGEPGAQLQVTRDDGAIISFSDAPLDACIRTAGADLDDDVALEASCYSAQTDDFVQPGRTYDLSLTTQQGELVQGRTIVPGPYRFTSPAVEFDPTTLIARCSLPDTPFTLVWQQAPGAWAYVVSMRLHNWPDSIPELDIPIDLTSVSVSAADTTLLFPINIGLFQRGDVDRRVFDTLRTGLPSEVGAQLVVLAADRNYTNAIRGGRFNPSGNVRIPGVAGDGIGVFGSVTPIRIDSFADVSSEPCPSPLPPDSGI